MKDKIIDLYINGNSIKDISDQVELSYERVRQVIRHHEELVKKSEEEYEILTGLLELGEVDAIKLWILTMLES